MNRLATGLRVGAVRWFLVSFVVVLSASMAWAQSDPTVVRVEEDWELVVGEPDADSDAPQVSCVISPFGHVEAWHAVFELNQQSLWHHSTGGLQLQVWYGELPVRAQSFPGADVMAQPGETIRWTQSVELAGGKLIFEVTEGTSATWGNFGGQGYLMTNVCTALQNLNAYSPEVSVANSGVSYAENRVQSLKLKRVRLITADGEIIEDDEVRVVHQKQ